MGRQTRSLVVRLATWFGLAIVVSGAVFSLRFVVAPLSRDGAAAQMAFGALARGVYGFLWWLMLSALTVPILALPFAAWPFAGRALPWLERSLLGNAIGILPLAGGTVVLRACVVEHQALPAMLVALQDSYYLWEWFALAGGMLVPRIFVHSLGPGMLFWRLGRRCGRTSCCSDWRTISRH